MNLTLSRVHFFFYEAEAKAEDAIEDQVIFDETYRMEEIANRYKIEYDGWGCEIVK
ncbi:ribonuclease E inhibitor RraB [Cellulosilyticum sp. I15G10I2]|uniref:ribonuclease E inhibitor RraB n=1 Tax=Cellulosilyticum sp. I15G10I2 TaxID=1892843 RepID=UPI0009F38FB1|nr:ribonuclease E inhibitor RraB [Cellulosilyticum sp. I15G10I2]